MIISQFDFVLKIPLVMKVTEGIFNNNFLHNIESNTNTDILNVCPTSWHQCPYKLGIAQKYCLALLKGFPSLIFQKVKSD